MMLSVRNAAVMAVLTFFISFPILGVQLEQSAKGLQLTGQWLHRVEAFSSSSDSERVARIVLAIPPPRSMILM